VNSIPQKSGPAASDREQVIARLISEVKSGRELVAEQKARIAILEAQVAIEQKNSASLKVSYSAAGREIESLRKSSALLEQAIALHVQTIGILTDQRDQAKKQARKARKQAVVTTVIAVALSILRFG
jgi:septal ring factor EnvC (AmiA/AmiB activator)